MMLSTNAGGTRLHFKNSQRCLIVLNMTLFTSKVFAVMNHRPRKSKENRELVQSSTSSSDIISTVQWKSQAEKAKWVVEDNTVPMTGNWNNRL